jgi:hypothetical protein
MSKNKFSAWDGIDALFFDRLHDILASVLDASSSEKLTSLLRDLADDLDAIREGRAPDAATLANAPLLINWRVIATPDGLRLAGWVEGHPLFGSRQIVTSPLWALNMEKQPWARTLSRFYALAEPAAVQDDEAAVRH